MTLVQTFFSLFKRAAARRGPGHRGPGTSLPPTGGRARHGRAPAPLRPAGRPSHRATSPHQPTPLTNAEHPAEPTTPNPLVKSPERRSGDIGCAIATTSQGLSGWRGAASPHSHPPPSREVAAPPHPDRATPGRCDSTRAEDGGRGRVGCVVESSAHGPLHSPKPKTQRQTP